MAVREREEVNTVEEAPPCGGHRRLMPMSCCHSPNNTSDWCWLVVPPLLPLPELSLICVKAINGHLVRDAEATGGRARKGELRDFIDETRGRR